MSCQHAYPGSCPTCTERELCGAHSSLREERAAHAATRKRLRDAEEALRALLDGTRDPSAHGLGASWAVEYEMPPSVNERVRKLLTAHFAAYPESVR